MIITKLMGGLGNQMFQYAAGRALALRHKTVLKLDLSYLQGDQEGSTPREYMLDQMHICAEVALPSEIPSPERDPQKPLYAAARRSLNRLFNNDIHFTFLYEFDNTINNAYFTAPCNTYLAGYWQSERYFRDVSDVISNDFRPVTEPDDGSKDTADLISSTNSVSIHFRRGDYVNDQAMRAVHGVCLDEYYKQCIKEVLKSISEPHFFLFSDDPRWVREQMTLAVPYTVISNGSPESPLTDLWLMSLCKHNIIANSSFSWWAAWLNNNQGKRVFAPSRWFADPGHFPQDLIPGGWERF